MAENENLSIPRMIWNQAVKAVRGDDTKELIESFTSEMTLVAEGLCEDQNQLRAACEDLRINLDRVNQESMAEFRHLEKTLTDYQERTEDTLRDLRTRLETMEKKSEKEKRQGRFLSGHFMNQVIVLAAILAGAWVITGILKLFQ